MPIGTCIRAIAMAIALLFFGASGAMAQDLGSPHYLKHGDTIVLRDDKGGFIEKYLQFFARVKRQGLDVVVDGSCISACSLLLGKVSREKICVTQRASFGFHAPFVMEHGRKVFHKSDTDEALLQYELLVREWITSHGGLKENMIFLKGPELQAIYFLCS